MQETKYKSGKIFSPVALVNLIIGNLNSSVTFGKIQSIQKKKETKLNNNININII